jgi:hypothetical protein
MAGLLVAGLLVAFEEPVFGADRKPPKIAKAVMVDKDEDGFADRVVLSYTEKIKHRADDDGAYPFRVVGYRIARVGYARGEKGLVLVLQEKTKTDPNAEPNVLYDRGRDWGVFDARGNEARTQTFKATRAFVSVPEGSSLLVVNIEGPGTVTTLDGSFACSTSCYTVVAGTLVMMLEAQPDDGVTFGGWSGACAESGTQPLCTLIMDANKTVGATFG